MHHCPLVNSKHETEVAYYADDEDAFGMRKQLGERDFELDDLTPDQR